MRQTTFSVVLAACAALSISLLVNTTPAWAKVNKGDRAAEFVAVKDQSGRKVKLKSFRNKNVVVLTFGASWCKPCKNELPAWDKLAARYKNKGVVFLAVNIDKELDKGKSFVAEAKLQSMRALYEPEGTTVEAFDPPTMPTTYVIDTSGIVRAVHAGYRAGDESKLAAELDRLIKK